MDAATVETFQAACADLDVSTSKCTPEDLPDTVAEVIESPAVTTALTESLAGLSVERITTDPTKAELERAVTGVSAAGLGVATSGSILLESSPEGSELIALYPRRHVAVLEVANIVPDLERAFREIGPMLADGGDVVLATGPSATADMGDLVIGAHGPREVHVVLVEGA